MINTNSALQIANYFSMRTLLGLSTFVDFLALIAIFACQEKRNKIIAGIICFICFATSLGLQAYDYSITHRPENIQPVRINP